MVNTRVVRAGEMPASTASRIFGVSRKMSTDQIHGGQLMTYPEAPTLLRKEQEMSLCNYVRTLITWLEEAFH